MLTTEQRNRAVQMFNRGENVGHVAAILGISYNDASKIRQTFAEHTLSRRKRLSEEDKQKIHALMEKDADNSEIARQFNVHHSTVGALRSKWGFKATKYCGLERKKEMAKKFHFRTKYPHHHSGWQTREVLMGNGSFSKPIFEKPKTYNDYLKREHDRVKPIFKSVYRPRQHLGVEVIV